MDSDTWAPVLDGVYLPDSLEALAGTGKLHPHADVLIGTILDEMSTFGEYGLLQNIPCNGNFSNFEWWTRNYYGAALGAQIPALYKPATLEKPVPNMYCD